MAISKRITYLEIYTVVVHTLDSGIDVGQKINVGPGKFGKNNKCRAGKIWQTLQVFVLKKQKKRGFFNKVYLCLSEDIAHAQ